MRNIQNIFTEDLSFSYKKEIHTKDANSNESVVSQYMANARILWEDHLITLSLKYLKAKAFQLCVFCSSHLCVI